MQPQAKGISCCSTEIPAKLELVTDKAINDVVNYKGRQYKIIGKEEQRYTLEHRYTLSERIGRGFLGTLLVVSLVFFAIFPKFVWNLFTQKKETKVFEVTIGSPTGLAETFNNKLIGEMLISEAIFSHLPPRDIARFRLASKSNWEAVESSKVAQKKILQDRMRALSPDITVGHFNRTFVAFLNDPTFLKMSDEEVKSAFDRFLSCIFPEGIEGMGIDDYIKAYDTFVDALNNQALKDKKPSPIAIGRFCHYLADKLKGKKIWVGFRVLEKFLPFCERQEQNAVNEAKVELQKYLEMKANGLYGGQNSFSVGDTTVRYIEINVDPRDWFGWWDCSSSLWYSGGDESTSVQIPELVQDAILKRIISRKEKNPNVPISIDICGRLEAEYPLDFTLPLVQKLINRQFFVDTMGKISTQLHPLYHRGFKSLNDAEILSLPKGTFGGSIILD